jgi:glycosyltransferase involved in cell wall biosynthesis
VIEHIAVVVPAADEQDEIGDCLASLRDALARLHAVTRVRGHVLVVLDDCHDRTADVVAGFPAVSTVRSSARCVGTARRRGAAAAVERWGASRTSWLASTDADCRVPPDWLTSMIEHAGRGAALVLGTVRPGPGLRPEVERSWYAAHVLRDGHPHVHAANLAIAADAYRTLGGWRDLAVHEDRDLVERAVAGGFPIARTDVAPVVTSARIESRTPQGFAEYLRGLDVGLPAVS